MPYAVPAGGARGRPSIYAALVAEWRAEGRTVPRRPDAWWEPAAGADGPAHAVTSWAAGRWSGPAVGRQGPSAEPAPALVRNCSGPA